MGRGQKKQQPGGLGRTIVKERKRDMKGARGGDSWLHTSEVDDSQDFTNVTSVTEQSSLDDFLSTAELAGTEFTAERLNVKVVTPDSTVGMLSAEQLKAMKELQEKNLQYLHIPRRPPWDENTTGEQLQYMERESFLSWRRQLARLEEEERLSLTPFERNLEFWRQLWRVVERSDVVVQIVDARNPLLFRSDDLVDYVQECSADKRSFLLLNKSDLLTDKQRDTWATYFREHGIEAAFWSALDETDPPKEELEEGAEEGRTSSDEEESDTDEEEDKENADSGSVKENADSDSVNESEDSGSDTETEQPEETATDELQETTARSSPALASSPPSSEASATAVAGCAVTDKDELNRHEVCSPAASASPDLLRDQDWRSVPFRTTGRLFTRGELVELFKTFRPKGKSRAVVGLVGYPNVGKSSSINALLQYKKVPVSATPGRTKHFQTLLLDDELMLCDCPGLVFPQFVSTKAEMVCSGILPIDQMRDHDGPINFVCHKIPRFILQKAYGIMLPEPSEGEDPNRPPLPIELLMSYGYIRGFMSTKGVPDCPRSARVILKDYVKGRLLYCHAPPGVDEDQFQHDHQLMELLVKQLEEANPTNSSAAPAKIPKALKIIHSKNSKTLDKDFFEEKLPHAISRGKHGRTILDDGSARKDSDTASISSADSLIGGKPWKKHHNKGKKEKTRRIVDNDY